MELFGYVKPLPGELLVKEYGLYKAIYCGLCRTGGRKLSRLTRLFLSYDFTALAALRLALTDEKPKLVRARCPYGLRKKDTLSCDGVFTYTAAAFACLGYCKQRDDLRDERGVGRLKSRLLFPLFRRMKRRADRLYPGLYDAVSAPLAGLAKLESAAGAGVETDAGAGVETDAGTGVETDAGTGAGIDTEANTGAGAGIDAEANTGAGAGIEAEANTGASVGTTAEADTGASVGTTAGADTGAGRVSLDALAHGAAEAVAVIASFGLDGKEAAIAREAGYHIGRFIYIADAADDLQKDAERRRFNPLAAHYGSVESAVAHMGEVDETLCASASRFSAAVGLAENSVYTNILQNIARFGTDKTVETVYEKYGYRRKENQNL